MAHKIGQNLILGINRKTIVIIIISSAVFFLIFSSKYLRTYEPDKECYFIQDGNHSICVSIKKNKKGGSSIISSERIGTIENIISEWELSYPVFHFECADINADGTDDILAGVIKATRFDSICRKRIFIFKLFDGYVRPLWMGSRVSQPLEDFKVIQSKPINLIRTIELEENGNFLVAEYKWKGFGLTFVKYIVRNCNQQKARKIFNQTNTNYESN